MFKLRVSEALRTNLMADKNKLKHSKTNQVIVLKIEKDSYGHFLADAAYARCIINEHYEAHPELFPQGMDLGYKLNGTTRESKKTKWRLRQIKVGDAYYRIRPSFILPYFRGQTDEVSQGLFLLSFGVPFWAIAFVFGRNPMYWYRLFIWLSSNNLVGTTIKSKKGLPTDILADEYHTKSSGDKQYIATTVGKECILGVEACKEVSSASLTSAYGEFQKEVQSIDNHYQPQTVNTDGWEATQKAWKTIFPSIIIIECFLHAFIKIRHRATKKLQDSFLTIAERVWNAYKATSARSFSQRLRRIQESLSDFTESPMKDNLRKLLQKRNRWLKFYKYPNAHRTSNALDRTMKFMNRHAINSQKFHSSTDKTSKNFRAFALLHNFTPSSPGVKLENVELTSPAARANGFVYHQDWLHNLLISASLGGFY